MSITAQEILSQANSGYIGINGKLDISSGYDSIECAATQEYGCEYGVLDDDDLMPVDERIKLADAMIHRWQMYRQSVAGIDYNATIVTISDMVQETEQIAIEASKLVTNTRPPVEYRQISE
jgi:hypothetical protein